MCFFLPVTVQCLESPLYLLESLTPNFLDRDIGMWHHSFTPKIWPLLLYRFNFIATTREPTSPLGDSSVQVTGPLYGDISDLLDPPPPMSTLPSISADQAQIKQGMAALKLDATK